MTATRMVRLSRRAATIAALAGLWLLAAGLLWRTQVPSDLRVPRLDPGDYFSAAELARTARYERFVRVDWLLSEFALLAALVVLAVRGPRLARGIGIGRIGTGIVVGMVTLTSLWLVKLPFGVAAQWWQARHGLAEGNYLAWLLQPWAELLGQVVFACLAIVIVMVLAERLVRRWWLAGAPAFAALGVAFALVSPLLVSLQTHPLRDRELAAGARSLARAVGAAGTSVEVEDVHDLTSQANAFAVGIGPSRRVVLWDTLLDGRFPRGEVRLVLAHELGHVARRHVWKGLAWFGLFALPGAFLLAEATRRRGGLGDPGVLPLGVLVLVVLQLASAPAVNAISRRYEAEADWIALEATRDSASARSLFERFSATSLAQPRPPGWSYVLLEDHPTLMQRIAMAEAWRARAAGRP